MDQILKNLSNYKSFWASHQPTQDNLPLHLRGIDLDQENSRIQKFESLIKKGQSNIFERSYFEPGHVTASVMLVDPSFKQYLLTHHKKLEKWLQLGGHADGETSPEATALQEAKEESGVSHISLLPNLDLTPGLSSSLPIDLDIHDIPPYRDDPAHQHFDFRYLALCHKPEEIVCSEESHDIAWFSFDRDDYPHLQEKSLYRLIQKTKLMREYLMDLPADFLMALKK